MTGPGVVDALALAAQAADELVVRTVRDIHLAWSGRAFTVANRVSGGAARVPQMWHDEISGAVYAALGAGLRGADRGLRAAGRRGLGPRIEATPRGRTVTSAVNGLFGQRLLLERPELAITMAVRLDGADVRLDPAYLRAAFPRATPDVVVFVPGLGENDEHWRRHAAEQGGSYGDRLAADTSWTPVHIRLNTGLPLAENGVALASLLDELVAAWPREVRRIALVGHSMGGLVARTACAVIVSAEVPWAGRVSDVVTLGTPHLGAPLAKAVALGSRALAQLPETAAFGRILDQRSTGIIDLQRALPTAPLSHARYHLVAATVTRSARHPVAEALGDLMVRVPSATGRPRRGWAVFADADVVEVPVTNHLALLNHPQVYAALLGWLRTP